MCQADVMLAKWHDLSKICWTSSVFLKGWSNGPNELLLRYRCLSEPFHIVKLPARLQKEHVCADVDFALVSCKTLPDEARVNQLARSRSRKVGGASYCL